MKAALAREHLQQIPLLRGLSEKACHALLEAAEAVEFQGGEQILIEGRQAPQLWILLQGACEVVKNLDQHGGRPVVLATLEPFATFGEMSFFHPAPHSASVRAKTNVRLLRLTRAAFERVAEEHPGMAYKVALNTMSSLADRLRRMDQWVAELLAGKDGTARVQEWAKLREQLFNGWML
jgi:CRP-like cAMP-binding protein